MNDQVLMSLGRFFYRSPVSFCPVKNPHVTLHSEWVPLGKCLREITSCGSVTGHFSEVNSSRDRSRRILSSRPVNDRLRSVESLGTFVLGKQYQELFSWYQGEMCITLSMCKSTLSASH